MTTERQVILMTEDEARAAVAAVCRHFESARQQLLDLYEREGWRALGYDSWRACVVAEFSLSQTRVYELLSAAKVEREFSAMAETDQRLPERRLRVVASAPAAIRAELFAHARELPTRELHAIRRELEAEITQRRPPAPTPAPAPAAQDVTAPDPDDRIDVALAEQLPWPDGSVDLGITSPPYCLGEAVPYEKGGDYADYEHYRQVLVPAWCAQLYRVSHPQHGRWCVDVPIDAAGNAGDNRRPLQPRAMYAHWLAALEAAGFAYRTTILWHKGQAGTGTDRGTESPQAPHVVAPVEAIIVVYRGSWRRTCERPHDLGHEDWLQLCGPRGLWDFPGTTDPEHPAPYPEELPRRLIQLYSWRGDIVGDPFSGRGTTAAVAARLGRRVRACDRSAAYVDLTRRWVARERGRTTA